MTANCPHALRWLPWLLFPIVGSSVAWAFRTSEIDWRSQLPEKRQHIHTSSLPLPDGQAIRLIAVADLDGNTAFYLAEREITWANWVPFVKSTPFTGQAASVSLAEAETYCRWLSRESRRTVRLPTRAEWQFAARQDLSNMPFPGSYNGQEPGRIGLKSKPVRAGKADERGFRDLAGGVWEWTAEGLAMGSAWSEKAVETQRIDGGITLPEGYRGDDVGFRILVEPE
jgi:hypothetical protein